MKGGGEVLVEYLMQINLLAKFAAGVDLRLRYQ
jgi:hypothetical protein